MDDRDDDELDEDEVAGRAICAMLDIDGDDPDSRELREALGEIADAAMEHKRERKAREREEAERTRAEAEEADRNARAAARKKREAEEREELEHKRAVRREELRRERAAATRAEADASLARQRAERVQARPTVPFRAAPAAARAQAPVRLAQTRTAPPQARPVSTPRPPVTPAPSTPVGRTPTPDRLAASSRTSAPPQLQAPASRDDTKTQATSKRVVRPASPASVPPRVAAMPAPAGATTPSPPATKAAPHPPSSPDVDPLYADLFASNPAPASPVSVPPSDEPPPYTGADLLAYRKASGLTQRLLAVQCGVEQGTVSKAEGSPNAVLGPALRHALWNIKRHGG